MLVQEMAELSRVAGQARLKFSSKPLSSVSPASSAEFRCNGSDPDIVWISELLQRKALYKNQKYVFVRSRKENLDMLTAGMR